jgi:hypothetical protein
MGSGLSRSNDEQRESSVIDLIPSVDLFALSLTTAENSNIILAEMEESYSLEGLINLHIFLEEQNERRIEQQRSQERDS